MSRIIIHNNDTKFEYSFTDGENLLELLRKNGFSVSAPCGGQGLCGKCRVTLCVRGEAKTVSACKTVLREDCEVILPSESLDIPWNEAEKIISTEGNAHGFGVAVDLGTTTVAVSLYDINSGELIGNVSRWNCQKSYGADVISRVGFCIENGDGLIRLCTDIREQIGDMINTLCKENKLSQKEIRLGFIAGNTVMEHIVSMVSPDSIAKAPYLPKSLFVDGEQTVISGIPFFLSPCIAGYVGGDITAGILASGIFEAEKTSLFIDVGTNGEIVLGNKEGLVSCAVASGPAFEGAGISCGMRAAEGAIYRAELTEEGLEYSVIGEGEARGICGSGLLDLTACLLDMGYIDESGILETDEGEDTLYLTENVYITQRDVRQLQLAKAAVLAGIARLTETEGKTYGDIDRLYLSGGFGTGMRTQSAVRIGMLPKELADKAIPLGNTSIKGAAMALLNPQMRDKLRKISKKCRYIELSSDSKFNDRFVDAMSFPQ